MSSSEKIRSVPQVNWLPFDNYREHEAYYSYYLYSTYVPALPISVSVTLIASAVHAQYTVA